MNKLKDIQKTQSRMKSPQIERNTHNLKKVKLQTETLKHIIYL